VTPSVKTHGRHGVKIDFNGGKFAYRSPETGADAATIKVRRGDVVEWHCEHGNFSILFKGHSPFEGVGVHGKRGEMASATISGANGRYTYAVTVLPLDGAPAVDDPEIIVDGGE
jgi:plastocyanin